MAPGQDVPPCGPHHALLEGVLGGIVALQSPPVGECDDVSSVRAHQKHPNLGPDLVLIKEGVHSPQVLGQVRLVVHGDRSEADHRGPVPIQALSA